MNMERTFTVKILVFLIALIIGVTLWRVMYWASKETPSAKPIIAEKDSRGCLSVENPVTPSDVVCAFYKLAEKGKIEEAMSYQTDILSVDNEQAEVVDKDKQLKVKQSVVSATPLVSRIEAESVYKGQNYLIKIEGENLYVNRAEVLVEAKWVGGVGTFFTQYNLCKVKGQWKIVESVRRY